MLCSCGIQLNKILRQFRAPTKRNQLGPLVLSNTEYNDDENNFDNEPLIELGDVTEDNDSNNPDRYITPPIIRSAVQDDQLREPALDELIPVQPEDYRLVNVAQLTKKQERKIVTSTVVSFDKM